MTAWGTGDGGRGRDGLQVMPRLPRVNALELPTLCLSLGRPLCRYLQQCPARRWWGP